MEKLYRKNGSSPKGISMSTRIAVVLLFVSLMCPHMKSFAQSDVEITEENFPDSIFRQIVIDSINGGSTTLTAATISATTSFGNVLKGKSITDLTGIGYFVNLTSLYCQDNPGLTSLDLSSNTKLEELNITGCKVTSLDLTADTALTSVNCTGMKSLTSINVSTCNNLQYLYVGSNLLTSIDLTNNTALKELSVYQNQLSTLDVSYNTALTKLYAFENTNMTSLDVSNNTALTYLSVYSNNMPSLDVTKNTKLQTLLCFRNELTSLDVSENTALTYLSVYGNQLDSLNVSNNTKLTTLLCFNNQLTSLDLSSNTALQNLSCYGNQLASLDLSNCTGLKNLDCHNNLLTVLKINPADASQVTFLSFGDNQLTSCPDLTDYSNLVNKTGVYENSTARQQVRTMNLYTDGTTAYLSVPDGMDLAKVSNAKLSLTGDSVSFSLGTATDGLVPLQIADWTERKQLFRYINGESWQTSLTYDYDTGNTTLDSLKSMNVTLNLQGYLLPMSQEYGSVNLPFATALPSGATAYAVTTIGDSTATLTEIASAGETVAANTPMLIRRDGTQTLFAFNATDDSGTEASGNLLSGTTDTKLTGTNYYVLGLNKNTASSTYGHLGLWRSTVGVGTWRAYLDMSSQASSAKGFVFLLDFSTTGIVDHVAEGSVATDTPWYTLSGMRLSSAPTQPGVYIHGEKKVIVE
jgi:Leucine-rich repeat (LRR) protein